VRIPVIELVEIGAGGGSIARVDALGRILVGPDSAGSVPGPACYGRGGVQPTVTDADAALGRLDPARFAGGSIALDVARARDAVGAAIGGMTPLQGAVGIAEIVDETMANAARVHAVENGKDTAGRAMIAFGGAAPLHAARLAQKLGIPRVVVPVGAGVGSAHGFLRAPIAYEVVRSRHMRLDAFDAAALHALLDEMRAEAQAVVRLGAPTAPLTETRTAFMRYRGQGHEIAVPLPVSPDAASLRAGFEAAYTALFGRVIPRLEVEAMTFALALAAATPLPAPVPDPPPRAAPPPAATRAVTDPATGATEPAALHERAALAPGMALQGPALIVEDGTTTVVPRGFSARVNALHQLVLEATP
jgi:N-methylhydantoinase A